MFVQLRLVQLQYVYSCTKVHAMYEGKTTYSIFVLSIISVALQLRRPECGFSPALSFWSAIAMKIPFQSSKNRIPVSVEV